MRVSSIQPQNYAVRTTADDGENVIIHRYEDTRCGLTKRCLCLFLAVIIVVLIMIGAIVLPLTSTATRNKDTSQLTTISTTENANSLETTNNTRFTPTKDTETANSSASDNDTAFITTEVTLTPAVNSTSGVRSMESTSTSMIRVDTSTKMNNINSKWTNNPMTTVMSKTETTSMKLTVQNLVVTTASTESESTTEITTTPQPMVALNQVNDTVIGLYNTTASGSTGGSNDTYYGLNEMPKNAMDDSLTTKYLNFGHKGGASMVVDGPGIGTGFFVVPSISNSTLACGLLFATANDFPERDPITVTLEGSNATTLEALHLGSSWTLIYNGSTGINATDYPGERTYGIQQNFSNTLRFASYRLLITSQRGIANSVQYSEARMMGYV